MGIYAVDSVGCGVAKEQHMQACYLDSFKSSNC
jgi:hypothetical protein